MKIHPVMFIASSWACFFSSLPAGCNCAEEATCNVACTREYVPVCAFSACKIEHRTFPNKCELNKTNTCENADYEIIYEGECEIDASSVTSSTETPVTTQCDIACLDIYKPVCGKSQSNDEYETFGNECKLKVANKCYGGDYEKVCDGECGNAGLPTSTQAPCEIFCPMIYQPVCGCSKSTKVYKTFGNECELRGANRCNGEDYEIVCEGECENPTSTDQSCDILCPYIYEPVCGCSNCTKECKTFGSICELGRANTCNGGDYEKIYEGECKSK